MGNHSGASSAPSSNVQLKYQLLRNTTSPDETLTGVKSYVANLPALEVLKLGTRENLRSYIPEHPGKQRNRVHDAIRNTILTEPQRFITRNSGFAITASAVTVDDNARIITLQDASVFNGAQSQGEIRMWAEDVYADGDLCDPDDPPFYVRAEIIVDPDHGEVIETAIARNTATAVKSVSQLGARGHLDDLAKSIEVAFPGQRIQKSETDSGEDSRKILQYTRLLMPAELSGSETASEKVRAYRMAERCLMDFSRWAERRKSDPRDADRYEFTVQMAPVALGEYRYWERHEAWNGQRVWEETKKGRACRRDPKTGRVVWVSPGLVFPILGALSEFVVQRDGRWQLEKPKFFKPDEMIARAVAQFRSVGSDPMQMGRSASVYDALRTYPSTIVDVMKDLKTTE